MRFQSGLEADQNRRILKDLQYTKCHKQLQELHEYKENLRKGQDDANKLNKLRQIEGYFAHVQPGMRIAGLRNRPNMVAKQKELLASIGLSSMPM